MMLKLIGKKRAIILGILVAVNIVLAGIYFGVIGPMESQAQNDVSSAQSEIQSLQGKIGGIKQDLEEYQKNLPVYQNLKNTGFLMDQDRFALSNLLTSIQKKSAIESFSYTIEDIKNIPNADADIAGVNLMASRISIERINTMLDSDFFEYLNLMQKEFPQQLRLNSFFLKKIADPDAETLEKIAKREITNLVTADAKFDWMTVVPKPVEADPNAPGAANGGPGGTGAGMGSGMGSGMTAPGGM